MKIASTSASVVLGALLALHSDSFATQEPEEDLTRRRPRPRDLRREPPFPERMAAKVLAARGARLDVLLLVEFSREDAPRQPLKLELDGRSVTLRDDGREGDERAGDGVFSAPLRIDRAELVREQRRLGELARSRPKVPVFVGRELLATVQLELVDRDDRLPRRLSELPRFRPRRGEVLRIPVLHERFILPGFLIPLFPIVDPSDVDAARSLLINDPGVVGDSTRTFDPCTNTGSATGAWTFAHLMTEMANTGATGLTPAAFTRRWLRRWEIGQTVNDFPVAARAQIGPIVIDPWVAASGGPGNPLDMTKAPFRLLAIVNRVDLRENLVYGGGSAGEGRFVFEVLDRRAGACQPLQFTVIFEYGIRKANCQDLKAWGQQWFDLKNHSLGSGPYNTALQAITDQFVAAGVNPAQMPNRSALNQLRTNEIALAGPWQLREFRLAPDDADAGHLRQVTVKQNPASPFNQQTVITQYVNANAADILVDKHVVPGDFPLGIPFLGGSSEVPPSFWDGPPPHPTAAITVANSRHKFSLNTCNACHGGETATAFTHVKPGVTPGSPGSLSGFMTGITVTDPAGEVDAMSNSITRDFNDLLRRQQSLAQLVNQSCFRMIFFDPLRMVH